MHTFHEDFSTKALGGSGSRLGGLNFAVARLRGGFERLKQVAGRTGDLFNRTLECGFVGLRRLLKSTQLTNEL